MINRPDKSSLLIVFSLLLALVAAGCGESDEVTYKRDLLDVGKTIERALAQMPNADTDEVVDSTMLRKLATQLAKAADELRSLDPPNEVSAAHAQMLKGLEGADQALVELADDLDKARDEIHQSELFVEFASNEQNEAAFNDLASAQEAYDAAGYRVFDTAPKLSGAAAN